LFFWDTVLDTIFLADICLNFRTTYLSHRTGSEVTESKLVALGYLRGWFLVDVASILPYGRIGALVMKESNESTSDAALSNLPRLLKALRLFKMAKLIRVLKVGIHHNFTRICSYHVTQAAPIFC